MPLQRRSRRGRCLSPFAPLQANVTPLAAVNLEPPLAQFAPAASVAEVTLTPLVPLVPGVPGV